MTAPTPIRKITPKPREKGQCRKCYRAGLTYRESRRYCPNCQHRTRYR